MAMSQDEIALNTEQRLAEIFSLRASPSDRFINEYGELTKILALLRTMGKIIVQTSGVFDLLHSGHAEYLAKAKALGDILVVGVDVDEWVRARKGPNRPVRPFKERVRILAHFRHVDILASQLGNLHEIVRPDILVASESTAELTPEAKATMSQYCGQLVCLPPQSEIHTTSLIAKMNGSPR